MTKHLSTALNHVRRSPYQAIAAIGISTLTFFIATIFSAVALGSSVILQYFETRPQVTAFFENNAPEQRINEVKSKLENSGLAAAIRYVSQDEALNIYREQNKDDPLLLEMVTASILPASLEIEAKDPASLADIATLLDSEAQVEEVLFQEDIVEALTTWTRSIRAIGLFMVGTFALLALVVILVIISMKISMKKDEIEILNLIGATRGYIRAPFLLEGIIYGAVGAFMGWIMTFICLLYSTPFLVTFLAGLPVLPIPVWFYASLLAGSLAAGLILGSLASLIAVKRFLK